MYTRHKQQLESFVRVQAFLQENPVTGPLTYAGPQEVLEEVVPRLRAFAATQVRGRQMSSGELRRQEQLAQQLIVRHMRPLVAVAKTQIEPEADVRLPAAIRMPRPGLGVTKLLQFADAMIEAAREFEAAFVKNGMPADFLARFLTVRNELEGVLGGRAKLVGVHVGAGAGLEVELRRGRRAVARLDAIVRASFDGDRMVLARWRAAKRLHQLTGGAASRGTGEDEVPVIEQAA